MIPAYDAQGNLPPGIHVADWREVESAFGGSSRRRILLNGLQEALRSLRDAGCRTAYIDGSFVTAKALPGDFDACWDAEGVNLDALDPVLLEFAEARKAQKERYGGEFFPTDAPADPDGTRFLDYFQRTRGASEPKGIVKIDLEDLT